MSEFLLSPVLPEELIPGAKFTKRKPDLVGHAGFPEIRTRLPAQLIDQLQTVKHRNPLASTRQAIAQGKLSVGFMGGSITAGWNHNWPSPVTSWLTETYPNLLVSAENAAIGATGSDSGCVRADREIVGRGCHLTFVEYAVNDHEQTPERRGRSREGLIRKLLADGQDVVLVYTYRQEMYADMSAGKVPASIAEFEVLAEHYGLGSVWVGLHALNEVRAGRMNWTEWLPDGLHPSHLGSLSYGQAVICFLRAELERAVQRKGAASIPDPLYPYNWQSISEMPLTGASLRGPWVLKRVYEYPHVEQVLETHTPGAGLRIKFSGRGLILVIDAGKRTSEFNYRIDGGGWVYLERERHGWASESGMFQPLVVADELVPGEHVFEMEVTHGNRVDCQGTECRLAQIGVLSSLALASDAGD
jgi:hypothetical protein